MLISRFLRAAAVSLLAGGALSPALAAETVTFISVGSSSANFWPSAIAIEKGFFAAAGIQPDIV